MGACVSSPEPVKSKTNLHDLIQAVNRHFDEFRTTLAESTANMKRALATGCETFEEIKPFFTPYLEAMQNATPVLMQIAMEDNLIDFNLLLRVHKLPRSDWYDQVQMVLFLVQHKLENRMDRNTVLGFWMNKVCDPTDVGSCKTFLYIFADILRLLGQLSDVAWKEKLFATWIRDRILIDFLVKIDHQECSKAVLSVLSNLIVEAKSEGISLANILIEANFVNRLESMACCQELKRETSIILTLLMIVCPEKVYLPTMRILEKVTEAAPGPSAFQRNFRRICQSLAELKNPEVDAWLDTFKLSVEQ
jgi:hypothetical protein